MPPPKSLQFQVAQERTDGKLATILRRSRREGLSWGAISRRLFADHGVSVSGQTLGNWSRDLGIEPRREDAA